jgi:hypothetical protein
MLVLHVIVDFPSATRDLRAKTAPEARPVTLRNNLSLPIVQLPISMSTMRIHTFRIKVRVEMTNDLYGFPQSQ